MSKHVLDGITYAGEFKFKCKVCGKRLSQETRYDNCEDKEDE